ncbi:MAG: 6-hydroxymethylpterin diphosphokinase MptE-like protein, partial [Spirochaetota bacterium]
MTGIHNYFVDKNMTETPGNTVFQKNMDTLRTYLPELCNKLRKKSSEGLSFSHFKTRDGLPVIAVQSQGKKILLHSRKDPAGEARRFVQAHISGDEQIILVAGMGLGYHVEELLKKTGARIIVIEPSAQLLNEVIRTRDLSGMLQSGRIWIFLDGEFEYEHIIPFSVTNRIKFLVHRPYINLFSRCITRLRDAFRDYSHRKEINTATLKRFDRLWTKNLFKNSPNFFNLRGVNKLKNILDGVPCMIIAAGPSAEDHIHTIGRLMDRVFTIAVDTCLGPMMKKGVIPDFVVTVDPQFINSFHTAAAFRFHYPWRSM